MTLTKTGKINLLKQKRELYHKEQLRPQSLNKPRMLVYVLASDTNLAPNTTGKICTLSCCKPVVRKVAEKGDWVVGMSTNKHGKEKLVYAMQVEQKMTFDDYYRSPDYNMKKPDRDPNADNFYYFDSNNQLVQVPNMRHMTKAHYDTDTSSDNVLIAKKYWYFGENAPVIPREFHQTRLVEGNRRGHRVIEDTALITNLVKWLTDNYPCGTHGRPRDQKRMAAMTWHQSFQKTSKDR